jgi:hypothetical protein
VRLKTGIGRRRGADDLAWNRFVKMLISKENRKAIYEALFKGAHEEGMVVCMDR